MAPGGAVPTMPFIVEGVSAAKCETERELSRPALGASSDAAESVESL